MSLQGTGKVGTLVVLWVLFYCSCGEAATTVNVTNTVVVPSVKRMGINLGVYANYDRLVMKNLVFRNAGFEGLLYQSVVRCVSGTSTGCVDENPDAVWPDGFWNGASYEVIWGGGSGRAGAILTSTAPSGGNGTAYQFNDSGIAPTGAYMILRKTEAGSADAGWYPTISGGGTYSTETQDLHPGTDGAQAIRLDARGAGQSVQISSIFDNITGVSLLQLDGNYRLTFRARGAGGSNRLNVLVSRQAPANTTFLNQTITLPEAWNDYELSFNASENGTAIGPLQLRFGTVNQSAVLLDDVSLVQTGGDPSNTTVFRDPVINALRALRPGLLRNWSWQLGDSLDNQIASPFARLRSGFSSRATTEYDLKYSLHEFLELCELIGTEPWYVLPITTTPEELTHLLEYLGGPANTPYGARRAALGRVAPWTDSFLRIHLEFGNEAWNDGDFYGGSISYPAAYGNRGNELYSAAKLSPYYSSAVYDFVLGGQAAYPGRNSLIHNASSNHDTLAVAPYIGGRVDNFADNEELFGPLFAEPESVNTTGYMRQNFDAIQGSSRPVPLSVYEVNLHTTHGAISQEALDSFAPSLGAGIAVADHMLMMLRDLGIKDQMLYSLTIYAYRREDNKTVFLWGAVRDVGATERKRGQYLALQLANQAIAGDLVQTIHSGDNPTWDQPLLNGVQFNGAHYLQSFAFADGDERSLVLFNLHRTDSLQLNFTGPLAPAGTVTMSTLTSAAINDTNEDSDVFQITNQTFNDFDPSQTLSVLPYSMTVLQWRADTSPPVVDLVSPANGATVTGTVSVTANATDDVGVARVDFYRDSDVLLGTDSISPYTILWNSATATPGNHTLYSRAFDTSGNEMFSSAITVTVADSSAPSVQITSPLNGSSVSRNTNVTIAASASDNTAVTRVDFFVGNQLRCSDTVSPYTCRWRVPRRTGVTYQLQAFAYDAAGNQGSSTVVSVTSR